MRRTLPVLLASFLALAFVPSIEAQQSPATLAAVVQTPTGLVGPGSTVRLEMRTTVTFAAGSYCLDPMRLEFSRMQMPAHASLVIEPSKIVFHLSDGSTLPITGTSVRQAHFKTVLAITPGLAATAYMDEVYAVAVQLISPGGPGCSVSSTKNVAEFTLKNEYRPDTHAKPMGWRQDDPSVFEVLATNNGNGITRIRLEEISVDPIAIGKLHAPDRALEAGRSGVFTIAVPDRSLGNFTAVVGLRSLFDGDHPSPTDLDVVTIFVGQDPFAAEAVASGTAPNLGATGSIASLLGMLLLRRRISGA